MLKSVVYSNQALNLVSMQSHPANRTGRPLSCTSSLAHAAAQRSI
jgi:hypothetical protein